MPKEPEVKRIQHLVNEYCFCVWSEGKPHFLPHLFNHPSPNLALDPHHPQHPQKSSSQHLPVVTPPERSPKMGGKGRPTTGFPTSERSRFHHPKKVTTRWWQLKHLGEIFTPKFFGIHDLQIDWRTHIFSDGLKLNHQLDKDLPAHHARMLRWPLPMLCVAATRGRWGVVLAGIWGFKKPEIWIDVHLFFRKQSNFPQDFGWKIAKATTNSKTS